MSSSLLKRSIELFDDDLVDQEGSPMSKKKKQKDPMSLIGTNRHGIKKELNRLKQRNEKLRKHQIPKNVQDEKHKYTENDLTDNNLYNISRIDSLEATDTEVVSKIVKQSKGHLSKNCQMEEALPEEKSVFSETDFDTFEKEYDFFK